MKYLLMMIVLFSTACARLDYIIEQGAGQMRLQNKSRKNKKVLADQKVPQEYKNKITKIEGYKKYFYEYFNEEEKSIYSRTTLLNTDAVTYLIVVAPFNEIRAHETCFPIMGCFPYLGFFDEESADKYKGEMEEKNFITWKRKVYAYSTLGYFEDTILSSFFHYDDFELAELIFHELFHTVFFAKDEVDLNEALANFFGKEMAKEYFQFDTFKRKEIDDRVLKEDELSRLVVKYAVDLNLIYQAQMATLTKDAAQGVLDNFVQNTFLPAVRKFCADKKLTDRSCYPLNLKWNNASFAAFMTYEKDIDFVKMIKEQEKLDLRQLLAMVKNDYEKYRKESNPDEESFSYYLKRIHNIPGKKK